MANNVSANPAAKPHRFDSRQQEAFLSLWRTYDRLRALEDELFREYDLTAQQYNTLRLLRGAYPDRMQTLDLAARLVSRAPDITRLLDKLEKRGLVERDRPVNNRRVVCVRITEVGITLLCEMQAAVRRCHLRQLGHLSKKELTDLIALLRAVRRPHEDADSSWR